MSQGSLHTSGYQHTLRVRCSLWEKTPPGEEMLTSGTASCAGSIFPHLFLVLFFLILKLGRLISIRESLFQQVKEQSREIQVQQSTGQQLLALQQLLKDKAGPRGINSWWVPSPAPPSAAIQSPGHFVISNLWVCAAAQGVRSCPSALQTNRYSLEIHLWMLLQSPQLCSRKRQS